MQRMRVFKRLSATIIVVLALGLAACGSAPSQSGLVLLDNVTLTPTNPLPTRFITDTPTPQATVTPGATDDGPPSSERLSPLEVITVEADFVLITPTLPPSKTPTASPTYTYTPTVTPTPSITVTATATMQAFPTSIVIPVTAPVAQPLPQICDSTWFFIEPRPASCPLSPPMSGQGVFQRFENGYMVWVGMQNAIYVMYNDAASPRWEVYRDQFVEGMPEDSPDYANPPRAGVWQPRRGFGMLWRDNAAVRQRIGWAIDEWEMPFSVQNQTAPEGTLFISDALGGVFSLLPGGSNWARHSGFGGF